MQSGVPKPQFAGWLLEQVSSGQYAGLRYVDNSRSRFRVPWKHNSRKDCSDEDCKIFWAWAVASGKISENPSDKAKWKTNFRCALNNLTKHFRRVEDHSKDSDDPHKVYQIISTEYHYDDSCILPDRHVYQLTPSENEELLCLVETLHINSHHPISSHHPDTNIHHPISNHIETLDINNHHPDINTIPPVVPDAVLEPSLCALEVSIHYKRREMFSTTVSCPSLQLHYQSHAPEPHAYALRFPDAHSLLDRRQAEFTHSILSSVQRGLVLEVTPSGVYGFRRDSCRVFFTTGDPREARPLQKIPQDHRVQLLSFQKYSDDLMAFQQNRGGSPDYTIHLCFGEKFPDGKPLGKKLIIVKVVPLVCRFYHEKAQAEGASSLHSDNTSLQISTNSLYDLIHSTFSLPD